MYILSAIVKAPAVNNVGEGLVLEPGDSCFIKDADAAYYQRQPGVYTVTAVRPIGLSTDSNGNTSLVGADGVGYRLPVMYHKWSNTSFNGTVGNGVNVQLDSLVLPAGTVGPNGRILIEVAYAFTGNNNKDPLVRIGHGTNTWESGAVNMLNNQGLSTQNFYRSIPTIVNKGDVASNHIYVPQNGGYGQTGESNGVDSAIDFSQDVTIYFGGTMLNAYGDTADTVKLLWYTATVLR